MKLEYKELKNIINKKEYKDIFNEDNLYLNNILINNNNNDIEENDKIPEIKITINEINNNIISSDIYDKSKTLIENMKSDFKIYGEKIKNNINNTIKDDYFRFLLINNLNEIESMIKLFKNNYDDIIN